MPAILNHPSIAKSRLIQVFKKRKLLDLIMHVSECRCSAHCPYQSCSNVKRLFRHGIQCTTRASGGCDRCKNIWYLLQLHARSCKESRCQVPRCSDLKEHLRRLRFHVHIEEQL